MPLYLPTTPPAGLDLDGLRKWTEEEFRRVAQSLAIDTISFATAMTASGGTLPTFTATPLTGRYGVVGGRLAFVNIGAQNTSGGTAGSGAQQVSVSLPWPIRANALTSRMMVGSYMNSGAERIVFGQFVGGAQTVPLYKQTISGVNADQAPLTNGDFSAADRTLTLQFYYAVDM